MRTVLCVCGDSISAPSLELSAPYVEGHNASQAHQEWRHRQVRRSFLDERLPTGLMSYRAPRQPTAATVICDVSGNTSGASAGGDAA